MSVSPATHLLIRDRLALAFRIVGAIAGLAIIVTAFVTDGWRNSWVVALIVAVVVGGALAYYLLTSMVSCPACRGRVVNFRIGSNDAKRKHFSCRRCGATAWMAEGFYWQSDING